MHIYEERPWERAHVEEQGMHAASPVIRLHPGDDVVIARRQLISGTRIPEENVVVAGLIPPGHKVATQRIVDGASGNKSKSELHGLRAERVRALAALGRYLRSIG